MARPSKHSRTELLDLVLPVFWRHGLDGTTVDMLVEATGLGRQSLYHQYRDKAELFHAALERYRDLTQELLGELAAPRADLVHAVRFWRRVREVMQQVNCRVCMASRIASEQPADPAVRESAEATARAVRDSLTRLCDRAASAGKLTRAVTPAQAADLLWSTGHGACMLGAWAGEPLADDTVSQAVALLTPPA